MGRGGRQGSGGGLRESTVHNSSGHPLPNRESIVLEYESECITYYSPEEGKMIYIDSGVDMIVSGPGDYPEDDAVDFIPEVEADLLEKLRKKLFETGEIGLVSVEKEFEFDVYAGPSHDRLEQRWKEGGVTIEMLFDIKEDSETWEEDDPEIIKDQLSRSRDPRAAEALRKIKAAERAAETAADEPDASSRPLTDEEIKSLEAFEDEKYAKHLQELAEERAEEIAEDRDRADWDSFSEEEKERRVSEAKEIISEEAVSRAEAAAEGETYTSHRRPADVSEALSRVAAGNDFLDLRTYGEYGVLSETMSMHDQSDFTEDQWKLARETVREIEAMASDMERRGDLGKTVFSEEGLRVAEAALREVAQGADGEDISESMDPDRSFLFQTDEDHCLAMAEFLSVLRTGKAGGGGGQGMSDSWRERNADIADAARDAAKYEKA